LIESKVTADFRSGQAEAYASELREYRALLGETAACAVLIAPASRLGTLVHNGAFDATIAVEDIIGSLEKRRADGLSNPELDARLQAQIGLLEATCGKRNGVGWTVITVPEKRTFADAYVELASTIVPELRVRPSSDGSKALTRSFDGLRLPEGFPDVKLKHEFGSFVKWKYTNLQFDGLADQLSALENSKILDGTSYQPIASGKSLFIRIPTPGIDPRRPFEDEKDNVRAGLTAVRDLAVWITRHAALVKPILSNTPKLGLDSMSNDALPRTSATRPLESGKNLERLFAQALHDIYAKCHKLGYRPTGMMEMMEKIGAIPTAKQLLASPPSEGFARLAMLGRLDLSIESLILEDRWSTVFTDAERKTAQQRLR
jgi:hypothetical protein